MIALFDSGYGGLTVFKPITDLLPQYDYLYLGDNARAPYGNRSKETIQKFTEQAIKYLFDQGATLIIIACNTASAAALRYLQQKYLKGTQETDRKILGVTIPTAETACTITKNGKVGIVGTRSTIESQTYPKEIAKIAPHIKTHSYACPLLVPFIEEGWHQKPEAISILKKYLRPLKSCQIDSLILGCTHYPFMEKDFQRIMGKKVSIISTGPNVAQSLKSYLQRHPEIEEKLTRKGTKIFLTTGDPKRFQDFITKHLKLKIKTPTQVELV